MLHSALGSALYSGRGRTGLMRRRSVRTCPGSNVRVCVTSLIQRGLHRAAGHGGRAGAQFRWTDCVARLAWMDLLDFVNELR